METFREEDYTIEMMYTEELQHNLSLKNMEDILLVYNVSYFLFHQVMNMDCHQQDSPCMMENSLTH